MGFINGTLLAFAPIDTTFVCSTAGCGSTCNMLELELTWHVHRNPLGIFCPRHFKHLPAKGGECNEAW